MHCWTCNHKVIVHLSSFSCIWFAPEPGVDVTVCVCPHLGVRCCTPHTLIRGDSYFCLCVYVERCDPSFFLLTVIVRISVVEMLKDTNKTEKSQTVAAVCFCLPVFVCWLSATVRTPCWLWLISDELSAGLPLPLCPTGGTSQRWHYFNYVLRGLSPWQRHWQIPLMPASLYIIFTRNPKRLIPVVTWLQNYLIF